MGIQGQRSRQSVETELGYRLSPSETKFVTFLLEEGNQQEAARKLVAWELEQGMRTQDEVDKFTDNSYFVIGKKLVQKPAVQEEYWKQMECVRKSNVADATEVMQYFTSVMRGEVKDQFGLDASLSDRTQAAKELAKRTIDIENRMAGKPDAVVEIALNWQR